MPSRAARFVAEPGWWYSVRVSIELPSGRTWSKRLEIPQEKNGMVGDEPELVAWALHEVSCGHFEDTP
jgi:hypothetical protein